MTIIIPEKKIIKLSFTQLKIHPSHFPNYYIIKISNNNKRIKEQISIVNQIMKINIKLQ